MRYIKVKNSNPVQIKAYGNVSAGGLGEFDASIYEEIEGELPANFVTEQPKPLATGERFIKFIKKAIQQQSKQDELTMFQRGRLAKVLNNSFRDWSTTPGGEKIDLRELIESFDEIDKNEWNTFIGAVASTKDFNGNNDQEVADIVLALASAWAETVQFAKVDK